MKIGIDTHMYLSLVIPAYNEANRIGATLASALAYFAHQDYTAEIIVVDDGSVDGTPEIVQQFQGADHAPVRLKILPKNRGKGFAVRTGMLQLAGGSIRFFYDADASTPIEELDRCHALFESGADVVIGSRSLPDSVILQRQAWYREYMGRCYNRIERTLGLTHFPDTQCGFKGFTASAAELCFARQTIDRFSFDAELLYIAEKHGLRIAELPVKWVNSPQSKVSPFSDAVRMFLDLIAIRTNDAAGRYD